MFIALLLLVSSGMAQSQVLYGAGTGVTSGPGGDGGGGSEPSSLYMINPDTGAATLIGPIGFNGVTGLAILSDGRLVASANADVGGGGGGGGGEGGGEFLLPPQNEKIAVLIEIDRNTGAGSLIGVLGNNSIEGECGRMPDISFEDSTKTLFGYSDACSGIDKIIDLDARFIEYEGLYIIDPDNADVNFIGPSGFLDGGNGMAVRPSDGTIFHTPADADGLVILNRNTGAGTVIPASMGNVPTTIGALDFNPENGELYGVLKNNRRGFEMMKGVDVDLSNEGNSTYLIIIDQTNGITDMVGPTVDGLDAIVFAEEVSQVPTLSEYGLIITGVLLLAGSLFVLRRRKLTI